MKIQLYNNGRSVVILNNVKERFILMTGRRINLLDTKLSSVQVQFAKCYQAYTVWFETEPGELISDKKPIINSQLCTV